MFKQPSSGSATVRGAGKLHESKSHTAGLSVKPTTTVSGTKRHGKQLAGRIRLVEYETFNVLISAIACFE